MSVVFDGKSGRLLDESTAKVSVEPGHTRGEQASDAQPRVPIIGLDAGCIPGTKPGCSARELERAGRDIVRSRLHRRRFKPA